MTSAHTGELTPVERVALAQSVFKDLYPPDEKIKTIVVDTYPALGHVSALRFVEWAQENPEGVACLPTGKSFQHFVAWVQRFVREWDTPEITAILEQGGIDPARGLILNGIRLVQVAEFYPIDPRQHNSLRSYLYRFYIEGFGLDPERALLMDCNEIGLLPGQTLAQLWPGHEVDLSLRYRAASGDLEIAQKAALARIDQWCQEYEDKIRAMGGIGFFLGGIGPDGHIGFNVKGSDHHSTTRLTEVNYQTQAAAATDLGGIEVARKRLVLTIGLETITFNPDVAAIIVGAGEAKAQLLADAIQHEPHVDYPSTALQKCPNSRFYITLGGAKLLRRRNVVLLESADEVSNEDLERILIDLAYYRRKRVIDLTQEEVQSDPEGAVLLAKSSEPLGLLTQRVKKNLERKLARGAKTLEDLCFLHTEPHHDDLMLGYLPYIVRHIRSARNRHFFTCFTGGFTAVTNQFVLEHIDQLRSVIRSPEFARLFEQGYFAPNNGNGQNRDVWQYLDGIAANNDEMAHEGAARRFLRNLIAIYGDADLPALKDRLEELEAYVRARYPGEKDIPEMQRLKAYFREFEAECLWGYFGWTCENVKHLRLGFYTGDLFTKEPSVEDDIMPIVDLIEGVEPDILSVALDPEASGPDTHYKVLQSVARALEVYEERGGNPNLKIWGYRNVWYRFHPAEADLLIPVSLNMFAVMHQAFMASFQSQKNASFPSPEFDGPFSLLAQQVQVEQYQKLKVCLGREWFYQHESPLIRATRGLVFMKELNLQEFYEHSLQLRRRAENR
ncbi:MAG: glucosamine-6-phosphate deaminase [Verrucomicrobiota bacterium]|nr:glucosamine-6-phosphate deaminase [Verrucomicrobiota bacterium]